MTTDMDEEGIGRPDGVAPATESDAFYRELVENASEAMVTVDADDRIVYANPAVEDLLGYPPDELVGRSKPILVPERLRSIGPDGSESCAPDGDGPSDRTEFELPLLHADGQEVPTSIRVFVHEHDGATLRTGLIRERSDRRERERALQERNDRLEDFAEVVAHDIKNPLSVAKGYAEVARENRDSPELEEVDAALDRIAAIVDDVLALSRDGDVVGETEPVLLDRAMRETWQAVASDDAMLRIETELGTIRTDRSRFRELLGNVFSNAVTHAGPTVTISVGRLDGDAGFYVEDDGPGIHEAIRDDVFECGYSTHEEGTGYGLSIVERIANAHGWSVEIREGRVGGARFEFAGVSFVE